MNIIQQAQAKREQLHRELTRIEAFLATAFELQQEFDRPASQPMSDAAKADAPLKRVRSAATGSGSETLQAVVDILRTRNEPTSTRDLLPLVLAKGIAVGGKSALATLSARISQKGPIAVNDGKWWFVNEDHKTSGAEASGDEAAEQSGTEQSAASLFGSNTGERQNAPALAS